jgi:glycosyltransferase involved in cell wall biosynthesis
LHNGFGLTNKQYRTLLPKMRVAYVHDWLVTYRGGEKVLEALLALYPDAPIYTLFHQRGNFPPSIEQRRILPALPGWMWRLRMPLLPLLPTIIESLPLEQYDLVISSSSCVAKGVLTAPNAKHISYVHSPMRYVWDQREFYAQSLPALPLVRPLMNCLSTRLRLWDQGSAVRVDELVANSNFVRQRIKKYYGRDSVVIHPPCDVERFTKTPPSEDRSYYLVLGAFVPYKRFDLAIDACEKAGQKLVVAGSGPELDTLRAKAGKNTVFELNPSSERLCELLRHAKALIFPGVEDFGMVAIEAMASGTPVIALKEGGALDFIRPGITGEFFDEAHPESLARVLAGFDSRRYSAEGLRAFARGFSTESFLVKFRQAIAAMTGE